MCVRKRLSLNAAHSPGWPFSQDGGDASESSSVVGMGSSVGGDMGSYELDASLKGSAPSSPPPVRHVWQADEKTCLLRCNGLSRSARVAEKAPQW